jgi:hypothetical protein
MARKLFRDGVLALRGGAETRILLERERLRRQFPTVKDSIAALDVQDAIIWKSY